MVSGDALAQQAIDETGVEVVAGTYSTHGVGGVNRVFAHHATVGQHHGGLGASGADEALAVERQDREDILYRLRLIEACINKTDKRTLRIWKQLQQLLHLESEETE